MKRFPHPAAADQHLDFLRSEQILERRLFGDHQEAFPKGLELSLNALVQDVVSIRVHKLLTFKEAKSKNTV